MTDPDPIAEIAESLAERHENYRKTVLDTQPFKDALRYLDGIGQDFLQAQTAVRLMASRDPDSSNYLLLRFAPHLAESVLATTMCARQGLQNAARRELRFLLEAAVKLSTRDFHPDAPTLEDRLAGLNDRDKRFDEYVAELQYDPEFEKPADANSSILSLYSELSKFVHATEPQFTASLIRNRRGEDAGMESVATLNRFNKLAFQVYDLVLVRVFYSIGTSMSGDIFVQMLDDQPKWRFHKGKFVSRLSRCFDYKHERKIRREAEAARSSGVLAPGSSHVL
ncbi:hypothetical protein GCM10017620_09550 [Brevundimonas intermedia]|uniref:HEPN AbiU2-like domain-containing protein n=1 Tax=Brevundimonas intermedia TaxID=74315 RepID=A0ABQ5T755_9CAUL|nr:hypothetical protein [Brevundimonas intermedia]GLK47982.1 hypothetical protein GCM10017620_09550 [Brevundimonas intermedia]